MSLSPAENYIRTKSANRYPKTKSFSTSFPFELDDFQIKACYAIEEGKGVLVAAPTGAGKTIVGEFAVNLVINSGGKCFYTTPIKALSNQKYSELCDKYGESRIGLLTGDTSLNSEAQVVVMTTEVLRNMIYSNSTTIKDLKYVVMDEVHYLADKFRGAVWEEILIHLSESVQVI
jgi:ATP-dependent RNA helicase HelY